MRRPSSGFQPFSRIGLRSRAALSTALAAAALVATSSPEARAEPEERQAEARAEALTAREGAREASRGPDKPEKSAKAEAREAGRLLEVHPRDADAPGLLPGDAKVYAEARRLLARGQPAAALKALAKSSTDLLDDRESLLRGDALLALGDPRKAKEAYVEALAKSQLKTVSLAAARGMVNVLAQLKEREQELVYLDALLEDPQNPRRPNILLQRAGVLRELKRPAEAADYAFRVVRDFPASPLAAQAATMLTELQKQGVKVPVSNARIELIRIKKLINAGEYGRAEAELAKLAKSQPKMKKAIELERIDMYRRRRMKAEEYEGLKKLYADGDLGPDEESEVLKRLGKIALGQDDAATAEHYFQELEEKYPTDPDAVEGQYLAAWIPYNAGDYEKATDRMLTFANGHRHSQFRPEALWFAGWSAYLAKRDGLARRAFDQLLEEYPGSELRPQARYWIGRMRQRNGEAELARAAYHEVLAGAPLSYWGFWAIKRLDELGEKVALVAPPPTTVATIPQVISLLGPKRPMNIDRAIALHEADLVDDALDELTYANAHLKNVRDMAGRTMIADLLDQLGAHYLAYRVGAGIASDGADLVTGKPWAWRAWRHAYPRAFEKECTTASETHDIDLELILSIMRTESSFRTTARSPVGAYGLMQLMPGTAQLIGRSVKDGRPHAARFRNPESNVWLGAWYLASLVKRYSGQLAPAIGAYNAGPGAMDRWIAANGGLDLDEFVERVPYRETRRYIRKVLETYMVYRRLGGEPLLVLPDKLERLAVPEGAVAF